MDLDLSEDQVMLKSAAREFLEQESPVGFVRDMEHEERGFTSELWQKLAEVGWLGLPVPEAYGGTGQGLFDLGLLMEEVGQTLLPGPFFNTVLCAIALVDGGTDEQKQRYLPQIVSGNLIATPALLEPFGDLDPSGVQLQATLSNSSWTLTGTKTLVENAHVADYLLVPARTGQRASSEQGITLFWVGTTSPNIQIDKLETLSGEHHSQVQFNGVSVPSENVIGQVDRAWPLLNLFLQKGAALCCFQMVGGFQKVLDLTIEYVKNRIQFGRPLGTLQVVQQACANMAADVDGTRYSTYKALWSLGEGLPSSLEVAAAKAWASESVERVCANAHQAHGSMGFTQEYDLQLFTRRLRSWEIAFGDAAHHRSRVVEAMAL